MRKKKVRKYRANKSMEKINLTYIQAIIVSITLLFLVRALTNSQKKKQKVKLRNQEKITL